MILFTICEIFATQSQGQEVMLRQIPGVSSNFAKVIMQKYATIIDLICDLQDNPAALDGITYQSSKNLTRKINTSCITNIKKFLIQE